MLESVMKKKKKKKTDDRRRELSNRPSWKDRFSSTEPIANVRTGNDCGDGDMSYWRKGKGQVIYFLKMSPPPPPIHVEKR